MPLSIMRCFVMPDSFESTLRGKARGRELGTEGGREGRREGG